MQSSDRDGRLLQRNLKIQRMNIKFREGLLGLKRLQGFLEVTTAQVHNGNYAKYREAKSRYNTKLAQLLPRYIYSPCVVNWDVLNRMGYDGEIDDILRIRLREAGSDEEIFTLVAWIRAFNINEPIYAELCHEFYSTYEFDEVCADDELQSKKIIKFRLGGRAHNLTLLEFARRLGLYQAVELEEEGFNVYFEGGLRNDDNFNAQDYWLSISREDNLEDLDTDYIRDLIDSKGKLIQEDLQPGVPRVGITRPLRASMQDLYDRMSRMEIRQDAIERMDYRQSYHWDSGQNKAMVFYQMDTEEVSDRFVAPCFVNGLEAYDGEINLGVEENMISNEYAVKLCLEHEVKRGNKVVKKELIVALRGEIYFVKFIINPEEDDVEPGVIFGRSFLRLTKAITDFGARTVTIYPDIDPFLEETEEERKEKR
ncbi:hypothetical protein Tco_0593335 [Tanacetum coccineum]